MLLALQGHAYLDLNDLPRPPNGKSIIDVNADYLLKLRNAVFAFLQKRLGDEPTFHLKVIDYYFSVPAPFNNEGRGNLRSAIAQASWVETPDSSRLSLITEPVAGCIYASKTGMVSFRDGDVILTVCCGAGTVDLTALEVTDARELAFAELTAGTGDSCG